MQRMNLVGVVPTSAAAGVVALQSPATGANSQTQTMFKRKGNEFEIVCRS